MMIQIVLSTLILLASLTDARADQRGIASFYHEPQKVACGGRFDPHAMTVAHRELPCGTKIKITNTRNGRSAIATVNDRGPFVRGRICDVSLAMAKVLGFVAAGKTPVSIKVLH